jgi:hypothetical protein
MAKVIAKMKTKGENKDEVIIRKLKQCDMVTSEDWELCNYIKSQSSFTIIAYGETNSGKTFTIRKLIDNFCMSMRYPLEISCIEIYNTDVFDLLSNREKVKYRAKETKQIVNDFNQFVYIFSKLSKLRQTKGTIYNNQSSRSHMILKVYSNVKIHFVDLAGSEYNVDSDSNHINLGLMCLKECILAVKKSAFIPYRRTKLTYFLEDSLKQMIYCICTIIPHKAHNKRTLETLEYGISMKRLKLNNTIQLNPYVEFSKKMQNMEALLIKDYQESRNRDIAKLLIQILNERMDLCKILIKELS